MVRGTYARRRQLPAGCCELEEEVKSALADREMEKKVRVRELQAEEAGGEGCGEEGELEGQVQRSGEEVGKGGLRRAFGKLLAV